MRNERLWLNCVDNVKQTATLALLISLLSNLRFSRLFGIMVTASPRRTQLVSFVKASNISGSKQERSTDLVKWGKSKLTKKEMLLFGGVKLNCENFKATHTGGFNHGCMGKSDGPRSFNTGNALILCSSSTTEEMSSFHNWRLSLCPIFNHQFGFCYQLILIYWS